MRPALLILLALALPGCQHVTADDVAALGGAACGGFVDGVAYAATDRVIDAVTSPGPDGGADAGQTLPILVDAGDECARCKAAGYASAAGCFGARPACDGWGVP